MSFIQRPNAVAELEIQWRNEIEEPLADGFTQCPYEAFASVKWVGDSDLPIVILAPDMERYMDRLPWPMERLGYVDPETAVYRRSAQGG